MRKNEDIESYLENIFGIDVLTPYGNIDRPFNISELKDFSKEKYVFLGNHTHDHAILTNYSTDEIKIQIQTAQNIIHDITGIYPFAISYPNGNYSEDIIRISKKIGLKLGITTTAQRNLPPFDYKNDNSMHLNRFIYISDIDLEKQCNLFRSNVAPISKTWNKIRNVC